MRPGGVAFDNVPEIYDRIRPSYPDALFDDLWMRLDTATPDILEVGSGTGKATASLLVRGARVTAVEPGPNMCAFLRRKFAGAPLTIINAPFETAKVSPDAFDVLFAATSFHWVLPEVRLQRAGDALRSGGAIAIVQTNQIESDADRGFYDAAQPTYQRYFPGEERPETQGEDVVPEEYEEIAASPLFRDTELLRYRWDQRYTAEEFAELTRSYSGSQIMPEAERENFVRDLAALVDSDFGGEMVRPLVVTLTFARRAR
jgi:SAM-dependent methyltransferase